MLKRQHENEDLLIEGAVKRDKTAFATLYDKHVGQVYRHVYYHVSNRVDAEDITQEVFIKAWRAIHKYKKTGAPFVAWLIAIARNVTASHYKAKKDILPLEGAEPLVGPSETNPETITEANLGRSLVRMAILKLRGDKQRVILMRFIDGFSYGEIARILNKSEGAVRVIQYRALNDLRHSLVRSR